MKKYPVRCPVSSYLCVMDGHWKPMIVWCTREKSQRFRDYLELLPDISSKVLTEQLKELEEDNIIVRTAFKEAPPRVEYSLTAYGSTLVPVLASLREWGFKHLQNNPKILHKKSKWVKKLNQPLNS
ncbi:MAG: winged helix-turn-helix transcriptional regulator [Sphingobacteriales bacterium]